MAKPLKMQFHMANGIVLSTCCRPERFSGCQKLSQLILYLYVPNQTWLFGVCVKAIGPWSSGTTSKFRFSPHPTDQQCCGWHKPTKPTSFISYDFGSICSTIQLEVFTMEERWWNTLGLSLAKLSLASASYSPVSV